MAQLFPSRDDWTPAPLPETVLKGRTVLVSGAGGSLGTALAVRLAQRPLKRLVLVDTSEHGLIQLKDRLQRIATGGPSDLTYLLGDLRLATDRERCLRTAPSIVLHMAAYKHVPFLEERPIAATQNNLLATADWLATCRAHEAVDRFVFVSTDKAVEPVGIMGTTKALAERLMRGVQASESPGLIPTTIRLCNVFGSRGSVVPRFCQRLRNGHPLPVTHPDMERWFTSSNVAARSVLQTLRQEGGTYVPSDCQSIPIVQLAKRLIQWARPGADPENWIRHVGPRPGERLREHLLAPSEKPGTEVEGDLMQAQSPATPSMERILVHLDRLRKQCKAGDAEEVYNTLLDATPSTTDEPTTAQ